MIIECPHCHTRVAPTGDQECPSCRKNVLDRSEVDPSKTSMTIAHATALPQFCHSCAMPTERFVTVAQSFGEAGSSAVTRLLSMVVATVLGLFLAEDESQRKRRIRDNVRVRVPQCQTCASAGRPEPLSVNSETYQMSLLVDRRFKQIVENDQR